ncbi:MAG TPA: hypothetical protein ENH85_13970 [Candidatus Scalindua sp.]|nr:hypothetical protein [Candidatus Scalindua sp.]
MKDIFERMSNGLRHLEVLHEVFVNEKNFDNEEKTDYKIYKQNQEELRKLLDGLDFNSQLYGKKGRQMILADLIEYIFLGRGYYSIQSTKDKENFVKAILHFVNLLMCYEAMTISNNLRKKVLERLGQEIPEIKKEKYYGDLKDFPGAVGLKRGESPAPQHIDRYFDSLLPKTAGGLWHELLVYVFLLRSNFGYIIPLLLSQRLMGFDDSIVPPDFLIIAYEKRIYGIEVGRGKEAQAGSFSLQTAIPTVSVDTENSRVSDRCPICKRWIPFCDFVIENYSDFRQEIVKSEVRCLEQCRKYSKQEISAGKCPFTKYSRDEAKTLEYTQHQYATKLHYHYRCVLGALSGAVRKRIVEAKDKTALKTHYPYYSGLEKLMRKKDKA